MRALREASRREKGRKDGKGIKEKKVTRKEGEKGRTSLTQGKRGERDQRRKKK